MKKIDCFKRFLVVSAMLFCYSIYGCGYNEKNIAVYGFARSVPHAVGHENDHTRFVKGTTVWCGSYHSVTPFSATSTHLADTALTVYCIDPVTLCVASDTFIYCPSYSDDSVFRFMEKGADVALGGKDTPACFDSLAIGTTYTYREIRTVAVDLYAEWTSSHAHRSLIHPLCFLLIQYPKQKI